MANNTNNSTDLARRRTDAAVIVAKLGRAELAVAALALSLDDPPSAELVDLLQVAKTLPPDARNALARVVGLAQGSAQPAHGGARYGRDGLVAALRACADYYGRRPTIRLYADWRDRPGDDHDLPHWRTYCEAFGGWPAACAEAGL